MHAGTHACRILSTETLSKLHEVKCSISQVPVIRPSCSQLTACWLHQRFLSVTDHSHSPAIGGLLKCDSIIQWSLLQHCCTHYTAAAAAKGLAPPASVSLHLPGLILTGLWSVMGFMVCLPLIKMDTESELCTKWWEENVSIGWAREKKECLLCIMMSEAGAVSNTLAVFFLVGSQVVYPLLCHVSQSGWLAVDIVQRFVPSVMFNASKRKHLGSVLSVFLIILESLLLIWPFLSSWHKILFLRLGLSQ